MVSNMRFTDNGDGTFTDNNTGLVWEKGPGIEPAMQRRNVARLLAFFSSVPCLRLVSSAEDSGAV